MILPTSTLICACSVLLQIDLGKVTVQGKKMSYKMYYSNKTEQLGLLVVSVGKPTTLLETDTFFADR